MGREGVSKTKDERGRIKGRDLSHQSNRAVRERESERDKDPPTLEYLKPGSELGNSQNRAPGKTQLDETTAGNTKMNARNHNWKRKNEHQKHHLFELVSRQKTLVLWSPGPLIPKSAGVLF